MFLYKNFYYYQILTFLYERKISTDQFLSILYDNGYKQLQDIKSHIIFLSKNKNLCKFSQFKRLYYLNSLKSEIRNKKKHKKSKLFLLSERKENMKYYRNYKF